MTEENKESGKSNIFIVPTSHASKQSSNEVSSAIENIDPEAVAIELDHKRIQRFNDDNFDTQKTSMIESFKKSKGMPIKSRITFSFMSYMQSKIISQTNVDILGLDMKTGYDEAVKRGIPVALVDRDISDTFNRFNESISNFQFIKTFLLFIVGYIQIVFLSIFSNNDNSSLDTEDIDVKKSIDILEKYLPSLKKVLIDERNEYISNNIEQMSKQYESIVLVIGAAHEPGISNILSESDTVCVNTTKNEEFDKELEKTDN